MGKGLLQALVCFAFALAASSCSRPTPAAVEGTIHPIQESSDEPSYAFLIQAVRTSVNGKTYTRQGSQREQEQHFCSQYDVEMDPYAKNNPELAKCPHVGAAYTIPATVTTSETVPCAPLTAPDSVWTVENFGGDHWRVSLSGSAWDVTKLAGQSDSVGTTVRVSQFNFAINAHQPC